MENNSKQALLSIVGIAILVIAVVGVSFAFFTYSKEGGADNVITTGSIVFSYNEPTADLVLENQFPQDALGSNSTFDFSVSGNIPATATAVNYTVTAIKGSVPTDYEETDRFNDSDIRIQLNASGATVAGSYGTGAAPSNSATGFTIATGTISNTGVQISHSFSLGMWVSNTVTISDTDTTATYRASADTSGTDTRRVYSELFYSLKIKVTANN